MIILFLLFLISVHATKWWDPCNLSSRYPCITDTSCKFTRQDSHDALKKYVDINPKDNKISRQEVIDTLDAHLPWEFRRIIPFAANITQIFEDCDSDKNGFITSKDFQDSADKCLPNKEDWCVVEWFKNKIEKEIKG